MVSILDPDPDGRRSQRRTSDLWTQILVKYGFSGAVAAFLLHWMTSVLGASVERTNQMMDEHMRQMAALSLNIETVRHGQEQTEYLLRQICYNTARDNAQRGSCSQLSFGK